MELSYLRADVIKVYIEHAYLDYHNVAILRPLSGFGSLSAVGFAA
jgi:hypothetical protein